MEEFTNYPAATQAAGDMLTVAKARRTDITLRQNIDIQIANAEARVKELHETKDRLEKSGMLDTRIDDIQRAMRL